jgi:hypothetical protein
MSQARLSAAALFVSLVSLAGCPMPSEAPQDPSSGGGAVTQNPTPPQGLWECATTADAQRAGFETVALEADGTWSETGRTDDQQEMGTWTQPADPGVDPSYGAAPTGMHGPYVAINNEPDGDGAWVYGWSEAANGSTLTLTLYAARGGMGLRWATPTTISLVAK